MAPRVRQSVAAMQGNVAAATNESIVTLRKVSDFIDDLHDGITIYLEIAGKAFPVKVVINPKDDAKQ